MRQQSGSEVEDQPGDQFWNSTHLFLATIINVEDIVTMAVKHEKRLMWLRRPHLEAVHSRQQTSGVNEPGYTHWAGSHSSLLVRLNIQCKIDWPGRSVPHQKQRR